MNTIEWYKTVLASECSHFLSPISSWCIYLSVILLCAQRMSSIFNDGCSFRQPPVCHKVPRPAIDFARQRDRSMDNAFEESTFLLLLLLLRYTAFLSVCCIIATVHQWQADCLYTQQCGLMCVSTMRWTKSDLKLPTKEIDNARRVIDLAPTISLTHPLVHSACGRKQLLVWYWD